MPVYIKLFLSFLYIGFFTIGGGYAALPLIEEQTVTLNGWLSLSEFADLVTISEITPGPIAINSATFVGMKVAGIPGALCTTLGFVLAPFIIVTIFYIVYKRYRNMSLVQGILSGLRPAVVALIASAGLRILILALFGTDGFTGGFPELLPVVLFAGALFVLFKLKLSPILVIFGCGIAGFAVAVLSGAGA